MTAMDCEKIASLVHNPDAGMRVLCLDEVGRKGPLHIPLLEVRMGQEADWVFTREVVNALAMEVAARESTIKSLEEDIELMEAKIGKVDSEYWALDSAVDDLKDQVKRKDDQIRELNGKISALEQQVIELQSEIMDEDP